MYVKFIFNNAFEISLYLGKHRLLHGASRSSRCCSFALGSVVLSLWRVLTGAYGAECRVQRRARRAFFSEQCREGEGSSRRGGWTPLQGDWSQRGSVPWKEQHREGPRRWGPGRSRRGKEEAAGTHRSLYRITAVVWPLTSSQTSWRVKSGGL